MVSLVVQSEKVRSGILRISVFAGTNNMERIWRFPCELLMRADELDPGILGTAWGDYITWGRKYLNRIEIKKMVFVYNTDEKVSKPSRQINIKCRADVVQQLSFS